MWKSGMMLTQTSFGDKRSVVAMAVAPAVTFACVSGTSFGFDVVPDVWRSSATVSADAGVVQGFSRVDDGVVASNNPTALLSGKNAKTGTRLDAHAAAAHGCATNASNSTACAGRSSSSNANSASETKGFSGASVQRAVKATNATPPAAEFRNTVARRGGAAPSYKAPGKSRAPQVRAASRSAPYLRRATARPSRGVRRLRGSGDGATRSPAERPRRGRGVAATPAPRNVHVPVAASPRPRARAIRAANARERGRGPVDVGRAERDGRFAAALPAARGDRVEEAALEVCCVAALVGGWG